MGRILFVAAAAIALLTALRIAAPDDGKAAFEKRHDTMKRMGRSFYLGVGRVVKGTVAYGPETVIAAETVVIIAGGLDATPFPAGSNVGAFAAASPRFAS